jgi:hypothetical protein
MILRKRARFIAEGNPHTYQAYLSRQSCCLSAGFSVRAAFAHRRARSEGVGADTASPVALQGFVAGFRAFRAPLQPDGLAVWGQGRGENKPAADSPAPALKREEWI